MLRSLCTCECHTSNTIIHAIPCCVEDPTILEGWKNYKEKIISPNVSELQYKSLELSFYAGAAQILIFIIQINILPQNMIDTIIINLIKEYEDYFEIISKDIKSIQKYFSHHVLKLLCKKRLLLD